MVAFPVLTARGVGTFLSLMKRLNAAAVIPSFLAASWKTTTLGYGVTDWSKDVKIFLSLTMSLIVFPGTKSTRVRRRERVPLEKSTSRPEEPILKRCYMA